MKDPEKTINELRNKVGSLQATIDKLSARVESSIKNEKRLTERIKELNCLTGISEAIEESGADRRKCLQAVSRLLAGAFQYPDITAARISFDGEDYSAGNFRKTERNLTGSAIVKPGKEIEIIVVYNTGDPGINDYSFLEEEKNLLDAATKYIAQYLRRKLAEEEIMASEDNLRVTLNSIGDALISTDKDGMVANMNPVAEKLCGIKLKEARGKPLMNVFNIVNAKTGRQSKNPVEKVLKTGNTVGLANHTKLISNNGRDYQIADSASPIKDNEGNIRGVVMVFRDVSQDYLLREKLRKSEAHYRQLFKSSPISLWEANFSGVKQEIDKLRTEKIHDLKVWLEKHPDFTKKLAGMVKIVDVNQATLNMYKAGSLKDFCNGLPVIFTEGSYKSFVQILLLIADDKTSMTTEETHFALDGSKKHIRLNWTVAQGYENNYSKVLVSIIDITERVRYENELRDSEERWKFALEGSGDGLWDWNLKTDEVFYSDKWKEMLGYGPDEISGSLKEWEKRIHPNDIDTAYRQIRRHITGESPVYKCEHRLMHKNGSYIWVLDRGKIISYDENGRPLRFIGVHTNITRQKNNEIREEVLFRIGNSTLITSDLRELIEKIRNTLGKIIDTTNFYIALYDEKSGEITIPYGSGQTGKSEGSWPVDRSVSGIVISKKSSLLIKKDELKELLTAGKIDSEDDICEVWLGVPLIIKNKVLGTVVVKDYNDPDKYDSTSRELLEFVSGQISLAIQRQQGYEALVNAKQKADESNRLKTAFLANISHEIRTPMNSILGFLELLKQPETDGEEKIEYINIVNKSGKRLLTTINDIIEAAKIDARQVEVHREEVNLEEIFQYLLELFGPQADEKGVILTINEKLRGKNALINTDRVKLESIFTNLLSNAVKFTNQGRIVFGGYQKGGNIVFYVRDTGSGVPESRQAAIFDRFVQADLNITRPHEGSGLGLSISREYINMLGGKIWLESEPGKGSTFWFTIPYNPVTRAGVKAGKAGRKDCAGIIRGARILVAEDDDFGYQYIEAILEREGVKLTRTINGEDTVKKVMEDPDIDFVLMDIKMPGMNGLDATRKIREVNREIPIIAQTAHALEGHRQSTLNAGCNDYISKPIRRDKLLELIYKHISKD